MNFREEFLKAKDLFEKQIENMKAAHKSELDDRDININILKTRNSDLQRRVGLLECYTDERDKLIDNEQFSRRHSLRFNGIPKKYQENSGDVLESVHDEIRKLKVNIHKNEVESP